MSRHSGGSSYGHYVRRTHHPDDYEIGWVVDFYYRGSRLRHPRHFARVVNQMSALRFSSKWRVEIEERR